jgi:hypothetical protein
VTQVVREEKDTVVDLFVDRDYENLELAKSVNGPGDGGVVEVGVISSSDVEQFQPVKFRAKEDAEQVTVGQGREFSIKAGRTYQAPRWVVEHLDVQDLVWH